MKLHRGIRNRHAVITAVFVISLFMAGTVHSKDEVKLTPEYLASGKWVIKGDGEPGCTGKAVFTKDGRFTMYRDCSHVDFRIDISGTYKIKGNKLTFVVETSPGGTAYKEGDKGEATLTDKDSLEYRWYLDFKGPCGDISNHNTPIKEGEAVSINGINAVSTGVKKGTVTAVLKIREKPDPSAKEITFTNGCNNGDDVKAKSIDKGKELTIYARTKDMVKTGKWNNYWYYVDFETDGCDAGGGGAAGWVFGEFVKIK